MATPPISASTYSNSWLCSPAMTSKTRRASRSTSGPTPSPGSQPMRAFMYRNQILIFNSFFTVGDFEEFDIRSFELFSSERVSKLAISRFERVAARMFPQHNHAPRHTDVVGRHDFIGDGILEHAVLMYSRLVSECILTDDRLIHLYLFTGKLAEQLAGAIQLLCLHAGRDVVIALSRIERHDNLFQRRVSGTLADPVDRAFDLAGAILNCGKTVGNRQSQIVVAVRADRDTIGILQALPQRTNELSIFRRRLITDGIRHVDNRRARINHRIEDRTQVIDFRAAGILGSKFFHRLKVAFRGDRESRFDHIHLQAFKLPCHLQLLFDVHTEAGSLFSISQCRVENDDSVHLFLLLLASAHRPDRFGTPPSVDAARYRACAPRGGLITTGRSPPTPLLMRSRVSLPVDPSTPKNSLQKNALKSPDNLLACARARCLVPLISPIQHSKQRIRRQFRIHVLHVVLLRDVGDDAGGHPDIFLLAPVDPGPIGTR